MQATTKQLKVWNELNRKYFEKYGTLPLKLQTLSSGSVGKRIRLLREMLNISEIKHTFKKKKSILNDSITITIQQKHIEQIALALLNEYEILQIVEGFPPETYSRIVTTTPIEKSLIKVLTKVFTQNLINNQE